MDSTRKPLSASFLLTQGPTTPSAPIHGCLPAAGGELGRVRMPVLNLRSAPDFRGCDLDNATLETDTQQRASYLVTGPTRSQKATLYSGTVNDAPVAPGPRSWLVSGSAVLHEPAWPRHRESKVLDHNTNCDFDGLVRDRFKAQEYLCYGCWRRTSGAVTGAEHEVYRPRHSRNPHCG